MRQLQKEATDPAYRHTNSHRGSRSWAKTNRYKRQLKLIIEYYFGLICSCLIQDCSL
jgi:hypothetical protein